MLVLAVGVVALRRVQVDALQPGLDLVGVGPLALDGVEDEGHRQHRVPGELRRPGAVGGLEGLGEIVDQLLELVGGGDVLAEHAQRGLYVDPLHLGFGGVDVQGRSLGRGHHQRDTRLGTAPLFGDDHRGRARRPDQEDVRLKTGDFLSNDFIALRREIAVPIGLPPVEWSQMAPELILIAGAVALLVAGTFFRDRHFGRGYAIFTLATTAAALVATSALWSQVTGTGNGAGPRLARQEEWLERLGHFRGRLEPALGLLSHHPGRHRRQLGRHIRPEAVQRGRVGRVVRLEDLV